MKKVVYLFLGASGFLGFYSCFDPHDYPTEHIPTPVTTLDTIQKGFGFTEALLLIKKGMFILLINLTIKFINGML